MRRSVVVLVVLLGGCSDAPQEDKDGPAPVDDGDPTLNPGGVVTLTPTNVTIPWEFELSETRVAGVVTSSGQCEELSASTEILSGTVVATWDSDGPASERLGVMVYSSAEALVSAEGTSPLEVTFEAQYPADVLTVDIGTTDPAGAANDMPILFEGTFTLWGPGSVEATLVAGCP